MIRGTPNSPYLSKQEASISCAKNARFLDLFFIILLTTLSCLYGLHAVTDLDLGWHLAGGTWMLDYRQVPRQDFLGADGNEWIAYSWLPEIIFATLYRFGGAPALQYLQVFSVVLTFLCLYVAISGTSAEGRSLERSFLGMLSCLLVTPFIFPICYLRPQLWSLILFIILLLQLEKQKFSLLKFVLITILWVNTHVFWVLSPLLVAFYCLCDAQEANRKRRLSNSLRYLSVLLLAGFCSPYGWKNYICLWDYLFHHREAYLLIQEFHPVTPEFGFLFWYLAMAIVPVIFFFQKLMKEDKKFLPFLFLLFFLASASQRKYLPFFGVVAAYLYAKDILPAIIEVCCSRKRAQQNAAKTWRQGRRLQATLLALLFIILVCRFYRFDTPFLDFQKELFSVAEELNKIAEASQESNFRALNYFDDGGWIGFALWVSRAQSRMSSKIRTTIDGRTLVMGQERLQEFRELITGTKNTCSTLDIWQANLIFVPTTSPIARLLASEGTGNSPEYSCLKNWKPLIRKEYWVVYQKENSNSSAKESVIW